MSPSIYLVSRGQTLFRKEGKGLGFGHRATCRPAPWSAYQSQHSIQSHDTWSMWLTGKFKMSVWIEREPEAWEVRAEREVPWDMQLEHSRIEIAGAESILPSFARLPCDVMAGFTWLIKFLGDKLLYGEIQDPFPRCGIGSGHARLPYILQGLMTVYVYTSSSGWKNYSKSSLLGS